MWKTHNRWNIVLVLLLLLLVIVVPGSTIPGIGTGIVVDFRRMYI